MKFLKSTVAIVVLLAIGSMNAKVMKKTQPINIQPVASTSEISAYIDKIFDENDNELRDMLITDYNSYDKKEICTFIQQLAGFIADEFPTSKPVAKKMFKDEMMGFCDSIKNDNARITFIQQCVDSSMMTPGKGTRNMRRNERLVRKNYK